MSDEQAICTSLPEDLESVENITAAHQQSLSVHLNQNFLHMNRQAHEALGMASKVELLFGRQSRMLAIRPAKSGRTVTKSGTKGARQIWAQPIIRSLNLPALESGAAHRFVAQLVEGALLIGPLPEATS